MRSLLFIIMWIIYFIVSMIIAGLFQLHKISGITYFVLIGILLSLAWRSIFKFKI